MPKAFLSEVQGGLTPNAWWTFEFAGHNKEATLEIKELFDGDSPFDTAKPVKLLTRILELFTDGDCLVLDFFAGSGTTGHAVLEVNRKDCGNRKFIMVQLPEKTGRKDYSTIAAIAEERVRRVIKRLTDETSDMTRSAPEDLGFKVFKLGESNFESWRGTAERDAKKYHEEMNLFVDPLRAGWTSENVLWEVAIKEGYGLNSVVEPVECAVNTVYRIVNPERDPPQSLRACLDDTLHPDIAKSLNLGADDLFVCRDRALDDTLAANLALQCRLKTI